MTTVYVVMGNDYPDAVFDNATAAEAYCKVKQADPRSDGYYRVYWRIYEFPLRNKAS